jgi:hypothetical protein
MDTVMLEFNKKLDSRAQIESSINEWKEN